MLNETIKNKVIEYLKINTKSNHWVILGEGIEANESIVYRFSSIEYPKEFALKVYYAEKCHKIEGQYAAIKRFSDLLNIEQSKYRVPKPLALFPKENCFLMEWVSGHSLKDTLWKHCFNKVKLQAHIKEGYLWLKNYHHYADLKVKKVDTSRYLENIKAHNLRSDRTGLLTSDVFQAAYSALSEFEKTFGDFESFHANIHGDLNLSNLIIGDDNVTGIDIAANYHLPIEDDLAQMLNYICVNYFNMLTRFDMRKPQDTWEIFNVVLDAYDYPSDAKKRDFFLFVFLYQMLYRWISIKKIHSLNKEKTMVFFLLGKWRLYNSAVIVKYLTKVINAKINHE